MHRQEGWQDWGPRARQRPCLPSPLRPPFSLSPQKLTVDLTAVLGVLQSKQQSLQQRECAAGSSRLYDLYWQAMKALGVQYVPGSGRGGALLGRVPQGGPGRPRGPSQSSGGPRDPRSVRYPGGALGPLLSLRSTGVGSLLSFCSLAGAPSQRRRRPRKSPASRRTPLARRGRRKDSCQKQ